VYLFSYLWVVINHRNANRQHSDFGELWDNIYELYCLTSCFERFYTHLHSTASLPLQFIWSNSNTIILLFNFSFTGWMDWMDWMDWMNWMDWTDWMDGWQTMPDTSMRPCTQKNTIIFAIDFQLNLSHHYSGW